MYMSLQAITCSVSVTGASRATNAWISNWLNARAGPTDFGREG
ncbi:hypothetical protein FHT09_001497 [Xanthomonas arboricola]|nr:hypothetical protein [Xanthomonas sp. CFBP 8152]